MDPIRAQQTPIRSDADIEQRVRELIGSAQRRQWWMFFLDDDDVQLPLIMPMDDYPESPENGNAELLADRIRQIMEMIGAVRVIFVWERSGADRVTESDWVWAHHLGLACISVNVDVRAQLISHDDGVRWFAPDDYLRRSDHPRDGDE